MILRQSVQVCTRRDLIICELVKCEAVKVQRNEMLSLYRLETLTVIATPTLPIFVTMNEWKPYVGWHGLRVLPHFQTVFTDGSFSSSNTNIAVSNRVE